VITGSVNASGEAVLSLEVLNDSGERGTLVTAVVDTGFTGFLTLPQGIVNSLSLPLLGSAPATLADGSTVTLEVYEALVLWHGLPRPVECLLAEGAPLIGMTLLRSSALRIQVVEGGAVEIEELP
jgi:clan AA aspartic protease